jgi:hypothetical protein
MHVISSDYGQASYLLQGEHVTALITVQGGHMRAVFRPGGKKVAPHFVAPWWREPPLEGADEMVHFLRGDFFCLPFGANEDCFEGIKHPVHGFTANGGWEVVRDASMDPVLGLALCLEIPEGGAVRKRIAASPDSPVLYCEHRVEGYPHQAPAGHHPILQFPAAEGSGILDMSEPAAGFTMPVVLEDPASGGYSLLRPGVEIADRTRVPTVFGDTVDLTRYPTRRGFEDVVLFASDTAREYCFSSVCFPKEGYLYFQLKDPAVLAETLLWLSNGGRHYAPWSGRVQGVLGLEEVTTYFAFGIKQSVEANPLQRLGFKTCLDFRGDVPTAVRLIAGCVAIPAGFKGVRDIRRTDSATVVIEGKAGEKIPVPCRTDFLRQGF